ncbi:hypothetical protein NC651_025836 [Populus alba x Populus x berolinensis]|nr:hypothetical protein NC651_025836 [Populus alba x Populus x berolinensis]
MLCSYLLDLKRTSAEEMRKSVYANYAAFIRGGFFLLIVERTSKEISDLEGELFIYKKPVVHSSNFDSGLAEGVNIDSLSLKASEGSMVNELLSNGEDREPSDLEKWSVEFPDMLDVLLAERRVDEALAALDEGERVAAEAKETESLSPGILRSLEMAITERRQKLADQLAEAACQPSTRSGELRAAISALKSLGMGLELIVCSSMHTSRDISIICKAYGRQAPHMEERILLHCRDSVFCYRSSC